METTKPKYSEDDKKNIIEIWKNVVETQRHFNDIEIRIRNFAITIFTFFLAGIGFCIKENVIISKFGFSFPFASLVSLIGVVVIFAIFFMDKHWYHRLLEASVSQGIIIEKSLSSIYPQINLTTIIKSKSPIKFFKKFPFELHSAGKLRLFYLLLAIPFLVSFFVLAFCNNDLILNSELNYIKNNSKRITLQTINKLPPLPGLIIILEKNGSLFYVKETDNLLNFVQSYSKTDSLAIRDKKAFYSESKIARKELEELIKTYGIKINEK